MNVNTLSWTETTLRNNGLLRKSEMFGRGDETWFGGAIDSRMDCTRRLFFALKGERMDGHNFAADATSKGSCAAIVDRDDTAEVLGRSKVPFFLVRNALTALQELSRAYRDALDIRVIAVTGSSGKTTTKEYVKSILKKKYRVHSNPGNYNNHIGVPLTLLETDHDNEYLVAEVAANHTGEIEFLSKLLRPDIGVITNVGDAHIGLFGSRERIAAAKAEVFDGVDAEGYAVLPADDDYIDLLRERASCRVVTFGYGDETTFRITDVEREGGRLSFKVSDRPLEIESFAVYNVVNAAAAYAVGDICGVEPEQTSTALAEVEPMPGRARVYSAGGITLIDDSYNANPTSMKAAIEALVSFPAQRRIAVLGDMGELGDYAASAHRELGAFVGGTNIDAVYWIGVHGADFEAGLEEAGRAGIAEPHDRMEDLVAAVKSALSKGDAVLVKASRASRLDHLVEDFRTTVLKDTVN